MIHFTSDHHFDHKNIIKLCNRPFETIEQMQRAMIERWNSQVQDDDTVFHLGDFCLGGINSFNEWSGQLRGNIRFIKGNHDRKWLKLWSDTDRIKVIDSIHIEKFNDLEIVMSHYPLEEWEGFYRGAWHLHGHCHGNRISKNNRVDVGVDCFNFYPVSLMTLSAVSKITQV